MHNKLISELSDLNFIGTLRYSGFVEPLLDKNIFNLVKNAREKLPKSNIEMVTNGDVLNDERLIKLYESGLTKLLISIYDGPEDVEKFQLMMDRKQNTKRKIFFKTQISSSRTRFWYNNE